MDYYKIERINFMFIQIIQKFYYSFIRNIFHPHVRINTSIIITASGNLSSTFQFGQEIEISTYTYTQPIIKLRSSNDTC